MNFGDTAKRLRQLRVVPRGTARPRAYPGKKAWTTSRSASSAWSVSDR